MKTLPKLKSFTSGRVRLCLLGVLAVIAGLSGQAATTDILWRDYSTGADSVWIMQASGCNAQGCAAYDSSASLPALTNLNWRAVATGDFNGDGQTDIVFRHYGTGLNVIWYMNGTNYLSSGNLPSCSDLN